MGGGKHVIRVGDMQVRKRRTNMTVQGQHAYKEEGRAVSFSERLLRDCALCTAAMLCVLGLSNTQQPVAAMAAQHLSQVATTDMESEEILGQLQFVHRLFPESVQVFWSDVNEAVQIAAPTQAEMVHVWAAAEPWIGYDGGSAVLACKAGEVMSVTPMNDGTFSLRIRHDDSIESLYSQLSECAVREGDSVAQGEDVGYCEKELLFEVRRDGRGIDPEVLM